LKKEAPGILNLMLAGACDYLLHGLITPEKVLAAVGEQRKSVDSLATFLEDAALVNASDKTPMKKIYPAYEYWCNQNPGFSRMSKHELGKKLEEKGFKKVLSGNLPHFHGLRLIENHD
jgi:phage/plasmid-associated DNA primase